MFKVKSSFNPTPGADNKIMRDFALKTIRDPSLNGFSKLDMAVSLENAGYTTEAIKTVQDVYAADPRSLDALNLLSLASVQLKDLNKAIDYRREIAKLDPWNADNYLQLGRYYKSNGDSANMIKMLNKILSFAPNTDQAKVARSELVLDKGAIK